MDYNQQNNHPTANRTPYSQSPFRPLQGNTFSTLSIYLGIAGLLSVCTGVLPFFLGSLSILFALLSKGYHRKFHKMAVAGICTSCLGILLALVSLISSALLLYTNPDARKEFRTNMNRITEMETGQTFDEFMEEYYHITLPQE